MHRTFEADERSIDASHGNADRVLSFRLGTARVCNLPHQFLQEAFGFFVGKLGHG